MSDFKVTTTITRDIKDELKHEIARYETDSFVDLTSWVYKSVEYFKMAIKTGAMCAVTIDVSGSLMNRIIDLSMSLEGELILAEY